MVSSKTPHYRFGDFELNPRARELKQNGQAIDLTASTFDCLVYLVEHRERPVGKDELIAAVWGSADVSDNLLAQAIVRIRRVLGENADERRYIKTLPRVGYRWMMETSVASSESADVSEPDSIHPASTEPLPAHAAPWRKYRRWFLPLILLLAALSVGWWMATRPPSVALAQGTVAVLPAQIDATDEWSWLHLGLMELISGDLRAARVPVEGSQTTLAIANESGHADARFSSYALVIRPEAIASGNLWHVRLEATTAKGTVLHAEASSDNVLKAAHSATAFLMAQIGAAGTSAGKSADSNEQYLIRMDAASAAGSMNVLRELIDKAPAELQTNLEFSLTKATFYCDQGEYAPCKQGLADLLARLPEETYPTLRGRALAAQWYVYFREHNLDGGVAALTDAIRLLQKQDNTGYLAHAYAQRGELLRSQNKLDEAESDFGLARINYALAGSTGGALGIDGSLAELDMQRGHFLQALPTIKRAYAEYSRLGMRQYLPDLLPEWVISQKMLLQHADALATTELYWPLDQKHWEFVEKVTGHILMFQRAEALAGVGRTTEASKLQEQLLAQIKADPNGEPGLEGTVYVALARLAAARGETTSARSWIEQAFTGALLDANDNDHDHAKAWLVKLAILQQAKDPSAVRKTADDMQAWASRLPYRDDWLDIQLLQAQAIGAQVAGQQEQALADLKAAMNKANHFAVPEIIADVGLAYTLALLDSGKVSEATAVSGQLSTWEDLDWRAAWAQASVYRAMGRMDAWTQYQRKARDLAGDRALPMDGVNTTR
ncbi:MAG: winged helix-turn-helix domain-containing protein [Luteibacter sp.]